MPAHLPPSSGGEPAVYTYGSSGELSAERALPAPRAL